MALPAVPPKKRHLTLNTPLLKRAKYSYHNLSMLLTRATIKLSTVHENSALCVAVKKSARVDSHPNTPCWDVELPKSWLPIPAEGDVKIDVSVLFDGILWHGQFCFCREPTATVDRPLWQVEPVVEECSQCLKALTVQCKDLLRARQQWRLDTISQCAVDWLEGAHVLTASVPRAKRVHSHEHSNQPTQQIVVKNTSMVDAALATITADLCSLDARVQQLWKQCDTMQHALARLKPNFMPTINAKY